MKTVLITGGSGMVGRRLSEMLIEKGYDVIWLSREKHVKAEIPRYKWNLLLFRSDAGFASLLGGAFRPNFYAVGNKANLFAAESG